MNFEIDQTEEVKVIMDNESVLIRGIWFENASRDDMEMVEEFSTSQILSIHSQEPVEVQLEMFESVVLRTEFLFLKKQLELVINQSLKNIETTILKTKLILSETTMLPVVLRTTLIEPFEK
jgi:hypothetical protein